MTCLRVTGIQGSDLYVGRLRVPLGHGTQAVVLADKMVVTDELPTPAPDLLALKYSNGEMLLTVIGVSCTDEGLAWYREKFQARTFRRSDVQDGRAVYVEVVDKKTRRGRRAGKHVAARAAAAAAG